MDVVVFVEEEVDVDVDVVEVVVMEMEEVVEEEEDVDVVDVVDVVMVVMVVMVVEEEKVDVSTQMLLIKIGRIHDHFVEIKLTFLSYIKKNPLHYITF
jgi:hypothetical protein